MRSGYIWVLQERGVKSPSVVYNITMQGLSGSPGLSMIYEHNRHITNWATVRHKFNAALREQLLSQSYKQWAFFLGLHPWSSIAWGWGVFLTALIWFWKLTDGWHQPFSIILHQGVKRKLFLFPKSHLSEPERISISLRNKKWGCILDALLLVLE